MSRIVRLLPSSASQKARRPGGQGLEQGLEKVKYGAEQPRPGLVERLAGGLFQSFDLVPDHQFSALQLDNTEIVRGKMHESVVQLTFQNPMFSFQFNEMRLNCHT
jgi:hypothetical protein